jgi:hypothetical protein
MHNEKLSNVVLWTKLEKKDTYKMHNNGHEVRNWEWKSETFLGESLTEPYFS